MENTSLFGMIRSTPPVYGASSGLNQTSEATPVVDTFLSVLHLQPGTRITVRCTGRKHNFIRHHYFTCGRKHKRKSGDVWSVTQHPSTTGLVIRSEFDEQSDIRATWHKTFPNWNKKVGKAQRMTYNYAEGFQLPSLFSAVDWDVSFFAYTHDSPDRKCWKL